MWYTILICFTAVVCWGLGLLVGIASERKSWLIRAITRNKNYSSAHHCNGQFFYIIEEDYFNHIFSIKTNVQKGMNEKCEKECEEELKGWRDEN